MSAARPPALAARRRVELDVREDIRAGREPFNRIVAMVKALEPGQVLVVRVPFEPVPLYAVLGARGLTHWTECLAADDWRVWFYTEAAPALDVRGLPPPQPMLRVLERVDSLAPGASLTVIHDRRPMFLYPQLEDRGFTHATEEPAPGVVRIVITRPPAP